MYYNQAGQVKAAGATALDQNIIDKAEDEGWTKVEQYVQEYLEADLYLSVMVIFFPV